MIKDRNYVKRMTGLMIINKTADLLDEEYNKMFVLPLL